MMMGLASRGREEDSGQWTVGLGREEAGVEGVIGREGCLYNRDGVQTYFDRVPLLTGSART
jgi:hypothetical protein